MADVSSLSKLPPRPVEGPTVVTTGMTDDESKKCETKGAGGVPFDKGSGTTVPPSAWVSVTCISVLLLFAVGPLGFSLQEKKQADRAASRKGPVLRIPWNSDGMILASASSNQTVKPMDGAVGKPRTSLEGYTGDVYSIAWSPDGKSLATGSDDRMGCRYGQAAVSDAKLFANRS